MFREGGAIDLLTKGDNNLVDDRGLYSDKQARMALPLLALGGSHLPWPYVACVAAHFCWPLCVVRPVQLWLERQDVLGRARG